MEGLSRLVTESLVRHGLDRPVDYRRLRWSRWFRCESHHSLLQVPSKPGVFALAEEIMQVGTAAPRCPSSRNEALSTRRSESSLEESPLKTALKAPSTTLALAESRMPKGVNRIPEAESRRMLAVTRFFEDDDMAFVLDRMLTVQNPLRTNLNSGRYFIRFVVIEDHFHRRSIHNALAQWLSSSSEKATDIGSHFAASLELPPADASWTFRSNAISAESNTRTRSQSGPKPASSNLDSGSATNLHCPRPFPSGF